jgi:hypothetical protein
VNQRRARVVSRARLTAVPTGSQVFAMAAPMVVPIPEVWVSAVRAVTVGPTVEPMAALTEEQMEVPMEVPTVEPMAALTEEPTEARTVGLVDPGQSRSV